jgi:hypothetical protein
MPYWSPADEVDHEAEAATIAASLFLDPARASNDLFVKGPRRIFARLLQLKLLVLGRFWDWLDPSWIQGLAASWGKLGHREHALNNTSPINFAA